MSKNITVEVECPNCAYPHNKVGVRGVEITDGYEDDIRCAACEHHFFVEVWLKTTSVDKDEALGKYKEARDAGWVE